MPASTMERSVARDHQPAARPGNDQLIRTLGGVELPAAGLWTIGRGQRVTLVRRGPRRRTFETRVVEGTFTVADDPTSSSLELTLTAPEIGVPRITISAHTARSIAVGYHGVFRQRGRPASMWLAVRARLANPELDEMIGHRVVALHADLNANPNWMREPNGIGRSAHPERLGFTSGSAT